MHVVSIALAFAQLGGCATSSGNPPYPAEWPSVRSSPTRDGCPDLRGTYGNRVSAAFPPEAGAARSLAEIFTSMARSKSATGPAAWGRTWPTIPIDAPLVSIEQAPETLTLTFIDAGGGRTSLHFRRYRFSLSEQRVDDLYICRTAYEEPNLRFLAGAEGHRSVPVLGAGGSDTSVDLLKSVDGSLVVKWSSAAAAVTPFILGSGYRVDDVWYRYRPLAAEPAGR